MEEQYHLFEKYILGEMKPAELADFEAQLKSDSQLAEDFDLFQKVNESMSAKFQNEETTLALNQTLESTGKKYFQEEEKPAAKVVRLGRRRLYLQLASVAAILLLLFVWSPWEKSLYDQFSKHPDLDLAQRNANKFDFSNAERAFNNENYQTAVEELEKYFIENPNDLEVEYYIGICQLELGLFDEADAIFGKFNAGNSIFKTEGTWYLALSNLKQNKKEAAKNYLQQIPPGSDRYQKAQELLESF